MKRESVLLRDSSVVLTDPMVMPNAMGYLWNQTTLLTVNCRGYASAQFMQPEPASYACAPTLEQTTFFQPEKPYHSQHPGRFFYILDRDNRELYSAPFAPVNKRPSEFEFIVSQQNISWNLRFDELEIELRVSLDPEKPIEHWSIRLRNKANATRRLSLYPYFPFGYRSWMNQGAHYSKNANAIISKAITPYQHSKDYWKQKNFNDLSFLKTDSTPMAWESRQQVFEGIGGLCNPDGIANGLEKANANYELPAAVMQFDCELEQGGEQQWRYAFGAAQTEEQVESIQFIDQRSNADESHKITNSIPRISTPDKEFDHFFNHWLVRQLRYHTELCRLTTDPQTRNYLQDAMGTAYLDPISARRCFERALSQQHHDGSLPDGILLYEGAKLKYINQVPHTDHAVWLPICLAAYCRASADYGFLDQPIASESNLESTTVKDRVDLAFDFLLSQLDDRGLSLIGEGDWCDPMNMVGIEGKGVSTWLTQALAFAAKEWSEVCKLSGHSNCAKKYQTIHLVTNQAINKYCWEEDRYCRGITDAGRKFGIKQDLEGSLFLNPQSWAILSGAADTDRSKNLMQLIQDQLMQAEGPTLINPPFTHMVEDIGRVTQKFPGTAENGSVYNHAAAFYTFACYTQFANDRGFEGLKRMIPGLDESQINRHGQLPVFVPNYYRGAESLNPNTAGRSSQLIHTGTAAWFVRSVIEQLFGVATTPTGLTLSPKLPSHWDTADLFWQIGKYGIRLQLQQSKEIESTVVELNSSCYEDCFIPFSELAEDNYIKMSLPVIEAATQREGL